MKTARKILPALAMLIVSAVMMSTASFAWFAMSTEVSATNMNVGIKSDSSYLLISQNDDLSGGSQKIDVNNSSTNLLPVDIDESVVITNNISDFSLSGTVSPWYYQMADVPTASASSTEKTYIESAELGNYVYKNTFYVGVANGSNAMKDLRAKVTINGDTAARVLIVTESEYHDYSTTTEYPNLADGDTSNDIIFDSELGNTEIVQVDIYIYYDGTADNIYTNGFASIANTTVNVYFTADVVS